MDTNESASIGVSLKQLCSISIMVLLTLLPLAVLIGLLEPEGLFWGTFTYVLSGQLFAAGWDRIHVGFTLDQPTIGKWYFWFTVFTVLSLSYMAFVRWFCVRRSKLRHGIFIVGLTILCLFLLCLLTIPFFWMIQYIDAMGYTTKRISGLLYGIGGYTVIFLFYRWAVKLQSECSSMKM